MTPRIAALLLALSLAACTSMRESNPARTATEQMLLSTAAERAVENLKLDIPGGARVFVDATNFEAADGKYAIGTIRERMLKLGGRMAVDRANADVVVEVRAGALSPDEKKTLVGLPQYDIPVPLSSSQVSLPEIALFKKAQRKGVAKLAAVAYDAKDGRYIGASEVQYGFSHETHRVVLLFASWQTTDAQPPPPEDDGVVGSVLDP
jgi:hypothetical protein